MISDGLSFEQVRDRYFINPRTHDAGLLPEASQYYAQQLLENMTPETGVFFSSTPGLQSDFEAFITSTATEMRGARRFDHLSMAQLHPADNIPGMLGHYASLLMNNNTVIGDASPVETGYEIKTIEWMLENIAGFDVEQASGSLVNGGTSANLAGLFVARRVLEEKGWDGTTPVTVFTNEMAHYSIKKACAILAPGGLIDVKLVPFRSGTFVMDTDALAKSVDTEIRQNNRIMAIVGIAGETETGLFEDLEEISHIARSNDIYLHIDAAYGGPFRLSRLGASLKYLSDADSITCDPHKYLYIPYSAGAILFRSSALNDFIVDVNNDGADYLFKSGEARSRAHSFKAETDTHLGLKRLEGSMGGHAAAALHYTIRCLGASGLGMVLDHTLDLTKHLYDEVEASPDFSTLYEPELNTLCFIPKTDSEVYPKALEDALEMAVAGVEQETGAYITTTTFPLRGSNNRRYPRKVFRVVPTHPHTTKADVSYVFSTLQKVWKKVTK